MCKKVQLHTQFSTFSTFHGNGEVGLMIMQNPSLYNSLLNKSIMLCCNKSFLRGFTSPNVYVESTAVCDLPNTDNIWMTCRFLDGAIHKVIRNIINQGYYVCFNKVDDYYIPNKSWYNEIHRLHDGIICGYDQEKKTYSIFAYDKNWIFRVFEIPQQSFIKGMWSATKMGEQTTFRAIKAKGGNVQLEPKAIIERLKMYLDNTIDKFPIQANDHVSGIAVQSLMKNYLSLIYMNAIQHEHIDRRTMRVIWEHKKCMYDRIVALENHFKMDYTLSDKYKAVVNIADRIRLVYAMYIKNPKKESLLAIDKDIDKLIEEETKILRECIDVFERRI